MPRKNYTKTTDSKHWLRKHPNLVKEKKPERAEQVFVSDITYIKSRERTHYLALTTDAYSRKIMGYHLSDDLSAECRAMMTPNYIHEKACEEDFTGSDKTN